MLSVSEFEDLYRQEETYDPANTMFDFAGGPCYDHIWIAALALNCTDDYLKRTGNLFHPFHATISKITKCRYYTRLRIQRGTPFMNLCLLLGGRSSTKWDLLFRGRVCC